MTRTRSLAVPLALLAAVGLVAPAPAAAEGFIDLYLGAGFPENDTLEFELDTQALNIGARRRADFDATASFGFRGGYWFEGDANFIGVGLDLSYYRAAEDRSRAPFEFDVFPITPLLMLRIPIEPEYDFPGGRLQPYGAIGPSLNTSLAYGDISEFGLGLDDYYAASFDVGLDARAGVAIHVARPIALFLEYRYTYLEPEYDNEVDWDFGPDVDLDVDAELQTHHLAFGVSFRF